MIGQTCEETGASGVDEDGRAVLNFLRTAPRATLAFRPDGRSVMTNGPAEELLRSMGSTGVADIDDLASLDGYGELRNALDRSSKSAQPVSGTAMLRRRDGTEAVIKYDIVPVASGGEVVLLPMSLTDVTDSVRTQRLESANRDVWTEIAAGWPPEELLSRMLRIGAEALGAKSAGLFASEPGGWRLVHAVGPLADDLGATLPYDEAQRLENLMKAESALEMNLRVETPTRGQHQHRLMLARMMARARVTGAVAFTPGDLEFGESGREFAVKLAAQASMSMDNASLFSQELRGLGIVREMMDHSKDAIAVFRPDGMVQMSNRLYLERIGRMAETLSEDQLERAARDIKEAVESAVRTGSFSRNEEIPYVRNDGEVKYWRLTAHLLQSNGPKSVLVIGTDVTESVNERKRMERLIREEATEKERLQAIISSLPVGIIIYDKDGRTLMHNRLRDEIWGTESSPGDVRFWETADIRNSDTGLRLKRGENPVERTLRSKETILGATYDYKRRDGTTITVLLSSTPMLDSEGNVAGAIGITQDITAQRELEHDAIRSRDMMELYLDLLSHDVNNLNAAAKGYLELSLERDGLNASARKHVKSSSDMLDQVSSLIDNVRKIQAVESGRRSLGLMDLTWTLEDVVAQRSSTPGREVDIDFRPDRRRLVLANEVLRDVFDNIIGNAIKHSDGDVSIKVRTSDWYESGKEYHRIDVEDDGPGIPDDMKDRLFVRFVKGKARGHGLGLYLVKRFVEEFNGRVWAEDRVAGDRSKGARFVVILPAAGGGDESVID